MDVSGICADKPFQKSAQQLQIRTKLVHDDYRGLALWSGVVWGQSGALRMPSSLFGHSMATITVACMRTSTTLDRPRAADEPFTLLETLLVLQFAGARPLKHCCLAPWLLAQVP